MRYYLEGCQVIVITDHLPLVSILKSKTELSRNVRSDRFRMLLQGFDLTVVYKEGKSHSNADALSRLPKASLFDIAEGSEDPSQIFRRQTRSSSEL